MSSYFSIDSPSFLLKTTAPTPLRSPCHTPPPPLPHPSPQTINKDRSMIQTEYWRRKKDRIWSMCGIQGIPLSWHWLVDYQSRDHMMWFHSVGAFLVCMFSLRSQIKLWNSSLNLVRFILASCCKSETESFITDNIQNRTVLIEKFD